MIAPPAYPRPGDPIIDRFGQEAVTREVAGGDVDVLYDGELYSIPLSWLDYRNGRWCFDGNGGAW